MDQEELRRLQAPLKDRYRMAPGDARITLTSEGLVDDQAIACRIDTGRALITAGLHPKTGGSGSDACSGDMLLDALVACAGVTLKAVATAMGVPLGPGTSVGAEGDLDFRGTLGVDRETKVGFCNIRLRFHIETGADAETTDRLIRTTERACVVLQTLRSPPAIDVAVSRRAE